MVPLLLLLLNSYSTALLWVPPLATGPLGFVPSMTSLQSCSGSSSFLPLLRHLSNHRISPVSPPFLWHLSLSLLFLLPRCAACFSFAPAQVSLLPWHRLLYLLCFFLSGSCPFLNIFLQKHHKLPWLVQFWCTVGPLWSQVCLAQDSPWPTHIEVSLQSPCYETPANYAQYTGIAGTVQSHFLPD